MALRYTGRATLYIPGHDKGYVAGDVVPITMASARALAAKSRGHTFETVHDAPKTSAVEAGSLTKAAGNLTVSGSLSTSKAEPKA